MRCPSDPYVDVPNKSMSNYAMSMGNQLMPDGGRLPRFEWNNFGTGPAVTVTRAMIWVARASRCDLAFQTGPPSCVT